jgi:hypothetical protein
LSWPPPQHARRIKKGQQQACINTTTFIQKKCFHLSFSFFILFEGYFFLHACPTLGACRYIDSSPRHSSRLDSVKQRVLHDDIDARSRLGDSLYYTCYTDLAW